eukprot:CAMPEP_0179190744 /NCGR_PEP_ID=MMETSP0796-20121207/94720_1 /TAXON_ID=73915 /ORGANISM="Pyrodinium bahamense, Strain pbaha01" /LENGTH=109 /DNA_ID=CAMNT_0020894929 /DNA_START=187 /DNA_END=516 /DNA_ORIENTATION=+
MITSTAFEEKSLVALWCPVESTTIVMVEKKDATAAASMSRCSPPTFRKATIALFSRSPVPCGSFLSSASASASSTISALHGCSAVLKPEVRCWNAMCELCQNPQCTAPA